MQIKYGLINNNIDVTLICNNKLKNSNFIIIPSNDNNRSRYFTDPLPCILKSIFIIDNNNITEYDHTKTIYINIISNEVLIDNIPDNIKLLNIDERLSNIQNKLILNSGSFLDELPEQKMVIRYLTGNEKVLELGGNIGRNSLIISYILGQKNNTNLVVLESDTNISKQLIENRDINKMNFHVENSALSKRKLIQKGWQTIISDKLLEGYNNVNIISYNEILEKYKIQFDTLILDCEGSFYYILQDFPDILENINLIIMENDYHNIIHKIYIDTILKKYNFYIDYSESGGWGPCQNNFFEVWKK